jgi:hypothetical protein
MFLAEMGRHEAEIRTAESPEAWLNSTAPSLLRHYPGPNLWTREALLSETRAAWVAASDRIEQCERCPETGGACAGHRSPIPPGRLVELRRLPTDELKLTHGTCTRWEVFRERQRVEATELPSVLVDYPLERVLGAQEDFPLASARQALYEWISRAPMKDFHTSLLLTGGVHTDRTRVLASIVRELVRRTRARIHYSWAPRLAVRMREHLDRRSDDSSPFERAEKADYLVIDFFDPKPQANKPGWADWFLERVDGLLFERLSHGRVTVLSSPRKLEELQVSFPQAGGFLAPLVVSLDKQHFGQVFG